MIPTEVWAPAGGVLVALLAYLGGRASSDATVAGAWERFLTPLREEHDRLWERVQELEKANAVLTVQREADRQELGVLRRAQRADALRTTAEAVAVRTTLEDRGITVPVVPIAAPPLERTRATDRPD